jgi:hypothetical protein
MNHVAQAANAVARGNVRASGLWGTTAARRNDDIFGKVPVFVPPSERCKCSSQLKMPSLPGYS